jgi:hypothetical protein
VKSIEAWTLADHVARAKVLSLDANKIAAEYKPSQVEDLYQSSDKPEKRSWDILKRITESAQRSDCMDLRVSVAEIASIDTLKRHCPNGFAPFAADVVVRFGTTPSNTE